MSSEPTPDQPAAVAQTEARLSLAEKLIGHRFSDRELLQQALTHPSACEEKDPSRYYERLEFLGDSVLGFLIAEEVYRRFPGMPEGGMTRIKVSIVAGSVLASVAEELGLSDCLILGESVRGSGSRGMTSALENAFEAVTAALYLDAGLEVTRAWVRRTLAPLINADSASTPESPKSLLQEVLQAGGSAPTYRIVEVSGPPHDRTFTAVAEVDGSVIGRGCGRSKKEAEAVAAAAALEGLDWRS